MSRHDPAELLTPVREFADTVLQRAQYEETGPLLADGLDPETLHPVAHDVRDVVDGQVLSNFAGQQGFLRALVGLTELTGDREYREAAERHVAYVFEHLTDEAGLIYWGGHQAYDLEADEPQGQPGKRHHELKADYPFYDLFWDVDPDATRRFVESFWDAHVIDWSKLDFNRHGAFDRERDPTWDREYEGGDVFFWGNGLTFVNTGSDLYYAAGVLADLAGDDDPLEWGKRLARRYAETRQETGISGYQFSQHPSHCNGPAIRGDRAQYQFAPYLHGDHLVYEGTLFRPRPYAYERQLVLGDRLGDRGEAFAQWATEELRAWREAAYRPEDNEFEPMLTDGLSLEGFVVRREGYFGPQGRVIGPIHADDSIVMLYATGYRTTGERFCWEMVRDVLRGLDVGEVGEPGDDPDLDPGDRAGLDLLYGLIELYRATETEGYLDAAWAVGQNVIDQRYRDGLFVRDDVAEVGDAAPMALVTLAAATEGPDAVEAVPTRGERPGVPPGGV